MSHIYDDGAVKVSRSLFEVSGTQFPIRNIGAVKRFQTSPDRSLPGLLILMGLGPHMFVFLLKFTLGKDPNRPGWDDTAWTGFISNPFWWMWLGVAILGILVWKSQGKTYHIVISTSGSDIEVFSTQNSTRFANILVALDEAISQH